MKPFDYTKLRVRHDTIEDYREAAVPEARDAHFIAFPSTELYPLAEIDSSVTEPREAALRVVACVNACHGLALPEDAPPGILADAIHALKEAADYIDDYGRNDSGKLTRQASGPFQRAQAVLSRFPVPVMVPPPAGRVTVLPRETQLENLRNFVEEWGGIEELRADLAGLYPEMVLPPRTYLFTRSKESNGFRDFEARAVTAPGIHEARGLADVDNSWECVASGDVATFKTSTKTER